MTTLNDYLQDTQRLLRESRQQLSNPDDLRVYINRARREVAMRSQCIRVLTPISAPVVSCTVVTPGANYSSLATVTITPPDFPSGGVSNPQGAQATAQAIIQGGTIAGVDISYGGDGYFQPQAGIVDSTGSGASLSLSIGPINKLNPGQEVYNYSDIDVSMFPGVQAVYFIRSISLIYSNYRYSLPVYDFSTYQSKIRQYPAGQYQWVPSFGAQFGQGAGGSLYLYPLPSQMYQAEFDCQCIPTDLEDNQSVEVLPAPWTDAVQYFAAHFAYLELQNFNGAKGMLDLFEKFAQRYSDYSRAGRITNPYGRWVVLCCVVPAMDMLSHIGALLA